MQRNYIIVIVVVNTKQEVRWPIIVDGSAVKSHRFNVRTVYIVQNERSICVDMWSVYIKSNSHLNKLAWHASNFYQVKVVFKNAISYKNECIRFRLHTKQKTNKENPSVNWTKISKIKWWKLTALSFYFRTTSTANLLNLCFLQFY